MPVPCNVMVSCYSWTNVSSYTGILRAWWYHVPILAGSGACIWIMLWYIFLSFRLFYVVCMDWEIPILRIYRISGSMTIPRIFRYIEPGADPLVSTLCLSWDARRIPCSPDMYHMPHAAIFGRFSSSSWTNIRSCNHTWIIISIYCNGGNPPHSDRLR